MEFEQININKIPFSIYCDGIKLPMDKIYEDSGKYQNNLNDFKINKVSYKIEFSKIDSYEHNMTIYQKDALLFSENLLLKPKLLKFEGLDINVDNIYIYSRDQIRGIIYYFSRDYRLLDNNNNNLENDDNYQTLEFITLTKKNYFEYDTKIYLDYKDKANTFFQENKNIINDDIIKINPILLSFNFYSIFKKILVEETFELFLNDDRKKFIDQIDNFANSEKKFLWLVGSHGIGKTISLMYYTLINSDKVFYINLKILNENEKKMKELLVNDLIKYIYFKNREKDIKAFANAQSNLKYLVNNFSTIDQNQKNLKTNYKLWIWLKNILEHLFFKEPPSIIILDQYRDNDSDYNYQYLNDFIDYIDYDKKCKLIISTSINNYDIQSNFYNNINHFSINKNEDEESNFDEHENKDKKDEIDSFSHECDFYENFLADKTINDYEKENKEYPEFKSDFILNTKFIDKTLKIYYSSLVSGKTLVKNYSKLEMDCFQNFNYNLKYINKFIKLKKEFIKEKNRNKKQNLTGQGNIDKSKENNNEKINNSNNNFINDFNDDALAKKNCVNGEKNNLLDESNDLTEDEIRKIIEKFYLESYNHIRTKISSFYLNTIKQDFKKDSYSIEMYKYLRELRDIIFRQDLFFIFSIRQKMKIYPGKYLRIIQMPLLWSKYSRNIYNYRIEYSNDFIRFAIGEIINYMESNLDIHNAFERGSGAGINFEKSVIDAIKINGDQVFGQLSFIKRIVFSLVGKTENSKKTIEKHRNEEKNYIYKFYKINDYSEKIDDIDYEKNSNDIKLTEDLYLIVQASKTARSFDFAILKRDKNTKEWFLYLFQVTINKTDELKEKYDYFFDATKCRSYLEDLYGIAINKIYLIFVLPFHTYDENFAMELTKREIHYIFFKSKQFYDKFENVINNLNFNEAELIQKQYSEFELIQIGLEKSVKAWEDSIEKFLKRKRKSEKLSFFYSRNISSLFQERINLKLSSEIKEKIFKALKLEYDVENKKHELLFIGNCRVEQIETVFKKNNLLIFYKQDGIYYFYFECYYVLENNNFTEYVKKSIIEVEEQPKSRSKSGTKPKTKSEPKPKRKLKYKKITIDLTELDEKIDLCFCYKILG